MAGTVSQPEVEVAPLLTVFGLKPHDGKQMIQRVEGRLPDGELSLYPVGSALPTSRNKTTHTPKGAGLFRLVQYKATGDLVETFMLCAKNPSTGAFEARRLAVADAQGLANVIGVRLISDLIAYDPREKMPVFHDDPDPAVTIRGILKDEASQPVQGGVSLEPVWDAPPALAVFRSTVKITHPTKAASGKTKASPLVLPPAPVLVTRESALTQIRKWVHEFGLTASMIGVFEAPDPAVSAWTFGRVEVGSPVEAPDPAVSAWTFGRVEVGSPVEPPREPEAAGGALAIEPTASPELILTPGSE